MEKKMNTRQEIQAGHEFAKQVIENNLDKRILDLQEIDFGMKYKKYYAIMKKTSCGMNDLTARYYENAEKMVLVADGKNISMVNNMIGNRPFTDEILKVDFRGIEGNVKGAHIAEAIRDNLLKIQYVTGDDGSQNVILWIESNLYGDAKYVELIRVFGSSDFKTAAGISVFGKSRYVKLHNNSRAEEIAIIQNLPNSIFKEYGNLFVTDGGRRNTFGYLFRKYDTESVVEFKARIRKDLNDLSGGLLDTIEEMIKVRKGISREKAFKLVARLSLAFTPMTKSVEFTSFAYYNGKFANSGNSDGQMTINGDKLADYYELKPEMVYGLGIQGRIIDGIITKGMQISISDEDANVVTYVGFKNRVHVSFAEFRKLWLTDALEDGVEYLVNVKEGKTPDIILDKDALKAVVNETDKFTFRIVSVKSRTQGFLNSQTMHGMMHLEGAMDLFEEIGKANIDSKIAEIYGLFKEDCKPSKKVVNPEMYLADMIRCMAPHYVVTDRKLYEFLLKSTANNIFKSINEFHFDMGDGAFVGYILNDFCEMITGIRALDNGQIHVPGMEDGIEAALDRNPKTFQKEVYLAVNSNLINVFKNIDDGRCKDVDPRLIKIAKHMYWYADTAIIVIPSDPAIKNCLGGSDCDGDLVTARIMKKFVEIQMQESFGTSKIPVAPESGIRVAVFTEDLVENMMIDGLFGQKDEKGKRIMSSTVGLSSNHNTLIQDLAVADGKLLRRVLDRVVDPNCEAIGYHKTDKKYEQHILGDETCVKNVAAWKATVDFYNSDRSVKSFRIFLDDCKKMAPSVVGRVIDMAKTGEVVFAWYAGVLAKRDMNGKEIFGKLNSCMCAEHIEKKLCFERNENNISTGIVVLDGEIKDDIMVIESPLSILREKLLAYFVEKMNDLFAKECIVSEFEQDWIENGISTGVVNDADLYFASAAHRLLSFSAGLNTADKKYVMKKMTGFVRNLFVGHVDNVEKFIKLKSVAHNSYFPQLLHEEYVLGINAVAKGSGWNTCDLVGFRAFSMDNKGAKAVEFQNGVSADGSIVTEKNVNGIWDVCYVGSTLYVVRSVEEYFIPERDASCMIRFKDFEFDKKVSKYNQIPDIKNLDGGFLCIQNVDKNSVAIFSDNYRDQYQINVPRSKDHKVLLNTNYNNTINNNGLKVGKVVQFTVPCTKDIKGEKINTSKTITIALGDFVDRKGKALPKAKSTTMGTDHPSDIR